MNLNRRAAVRAAVALFALSSASWAAPAARLNEFGSLGRQAGAISAAVGNQDMSAAFERLNGLFTGSGFKKGSSEGVPVAAGEWKIAPRLHLAAAPRVASRREPAPPKFIKTGAVEDEAIRRAKEILREAERAAREIAERDRTDDAKKKYGGCRMDNTCP